MSLMKNKNCFKNQSLSTKLLMCLKFQGFELQNKIPFFSMSVLYCIHKRNSLKYHHLCYDINEKSFRCVNMVKWYADILNMQFSINLSWNFGTQYTCKED